MKDEIKEILEDNGELMVRYKDNSFECFDTLPKNVVDYITNLQKTNKNHSKKLIELGDKITNLQEENERLKKDKNMIFDANCNLSKVMNDYKTKLERYKNIIEIMEKYFELINDLVFDYDGCETTGDLMNLIDELKKYASLGRVANTTEVIYVSGNNKKYNILHEELKGSDK